MARRGPKLKLTDEHINKMKALMRLSPTLEDTAAFFECSVETIETFVKKHWGLKFPEFREQNAVETRLTLRRTAIQKASKGDNTMLIWCMKNLCGWKDRHDVTTNDASTNTAAPQIIVSLPKNGRESK